MAIRIPDAASIAEKWARVTPGRQQDYTQGVQQAGQAWQEGVNASADNYALGVQAAIGEGSYHRGVQGKGQKFATKSSQIGAGRWAQGVPAARADMEQGVQRTVAALRGLTLPPRGPKGAPQNMQRAAAVVEALRAARM